MISGTSHPGVDGGHAAERSFLTAAVHPSSRSFKNTISLDQVMSKQLGKHTRYAALTLGHHSLSWSSNGVATPAQSRPDKLFVELFSKTDAKSLAQSIQNFKDGQSVMDYVLNEAKALNKKVSYQDQEKLDQYFTAVRETEKNLQKSIDWSNQPKPEVSAENPGFHGSDDIIANLDSFFKIMTLALETDQTRIITYGGQGGSNVPPLKGVRMGYHTLTHHGQNPNMISQLEIIDRAILKSWSQWIENLSNIREGELSLLDQTHVLMGSNLGSASGHLTTNLPVLLAGGSFEHGQHLAFDNKKNEPFCNVFLSTLHAMGMKEKSFASSTRLLPGLKIKA